MSNDCLFDVLQLSYSSASPALSSKDKYKRFFRVFPPESSFNPAKFDLLDFFGWKKVGTIYDGRELFSLVNSGLKFCLPGGIFYDKLCGIDDAVIYNNRPISIYMHSATDKSNVCV